MSINHSARSGGIIGIFLDFILHESMLCVLIEAFLIRTHNIHFNITKEIHPKLSKISSSGILGLEKGFETGVVNEPSVFEPLKVYCNSKRNILISAVLSLFHIVIYKFFIDYLQNK